MDDSPVVLVVEDEALIHYMIEDTLAEGGYAAVFASSGERAVELLRAKDQTFRALLTDINLGRGKLAGWDVARHAREINPKLPVVYMTGDSGHEWAAQGVPNSLLLSKPFASAQMLTAVSELINEATSSV